MSKSKNRNGCPTMSEQSVIQHELAYNRVQKLMAKNTSKAADILILLLGRVHASVDPKSKGKKDVDGNDLYSPSRYKENTQLAVAKEFMANNKEFQRAQEALQKLDEAVVDAEEEDYSISIDLSSEETANKTIN